MASRKRPHEALRRLVHGNGGETDLESRMLSDEVKDEMVELTDPARVLHRYAGPLRDELGEAGEGERRRALLVALLPFSRLVHALSVPLGYLARPYQVVIWYRERISR